MRRRHLWLAGGLVCGLLGCSSSQRTPDNRFVQTPPARQTSTSSSTPSTAKNDRKPKDEPAKELQAKPSSCVTMGDFYANCAADENRADGERQRFAVEARKTYRRALQQDPKYLPAFLGLGRLAESIDEREEAVAVYNEALAHHPKEATIWFERGVSLSRLKRFDQALASYQRAAQIDSKNKAYNVSTGYMLAIMGRHDEALTWLKRVMPEPAARYSIALALRKLGKEDEGRQQLELALRGDPNHKPSLELLARWNEPGFRGGEDPVQQAKFASPDGTQPMETPQAVVITTPPAVDTAPASLPIRQVPATDVHWSKAETPAKTAPVEAAKPPMPLIPVLSEHWETKPTPPPALTGLSPVAKVSATPPRPVAKLGFDDQP